MAHLPRGLRGDRRGATHTLMDEAGGHAVVVGRHDPAAPGAPRRDAGPRTRSPTPSATRPTSTSRSPALVIAREHPRPLRRPAAAAGLRADGRAPSPTSAASRSTSTAPGSSTPSSPSASRPRELAAPADSVTFCLSKGLSARSARSSSGSARSSGGRAARASCSAAGCARPACSPRPGWSRCATARRRRHDRAARRGPRQRPPPRRRASPALDGVRSPGRHRAARATARARPRPRRDQLRPVPGRPATAPPSSPPSRRGACCMVPYPHGQVRAVTHYGITADRHRARDRRGRRGAARHRSPTRPASPRRAPPDAGGTGAATTSRGHRRPPTSAPSRRGRRRTDDRTSSPTSTCRDPRPRPTAGPLDDAVLRPRRGPLPAPVRRQPGARDATSASTPRTTASATQPRRRPARDRRRPRAPRGGRGARRRRAVARRPVRARPRDPQPPPGALRRRRGPALGAPVDGGRRASATRCSCCSPATPRRSPSASSGSPTGSRPRPAFLERLADPRGRPAGPPLAGGRGALRRRTCPALFDEVLAAADGRRSRRPELRPAATGRSRRANAALDDYAGWLRRDARRRDRRLGARPRALRRARRGCGRSTASTPTRSSQIGEEQLATQPRGARARRPARSTRTPTCATVIDRLKRDHPATFEEALDGYRDVMRRARAAPHRARHRDASRRTSAIEVIATPEYLRSVMPFAAYFEPARFDADAVGALHRHAVGRRRPERDARALLGARSATPASTRRTRATTSSSRWRRATRA